AHAPGVAGEDEPVQFLERPVGVVDEPIGEPVQEFRVSGCGTHEAEVAGGADEADAEVLLPDAVDDDARGQWVIRAGEPLGEAETATGGLRAGRGKNRLMFRGDDRDSGSDFLGGPTGISTGKDVSGDRVRGWFAQ